jgi:hypothetical protein
VYYANLGRLDIKLLVQFFPDFRELGTTTALLILLIDIENDRFPGNRRIYVARRSPS